ncbi:MAG: response regulator transcription factor [Pleurocapsa sp.]
MIRILIVDDQNLVQQGIKSLLDRDMDFKVIGTVKDGRNAVKQIAQIHPDVVLLDIEMPGMNGITTTKYINRVSPKTKVIILSSHEDKKYVTQALMAGAKGYILKTSLMTDLKQAILAVNNGYSQIDSRLLAKVFDPQNIKPKRNNATKKSNFDRTESPKLSSNQNENQVNANQDELDEINHSLETHSPKPTPKSPEKAKKHKSVPVELDMAIQSEQSANVFQKTAVWKPKENVLSSDVSDSVVLEQIDNQENLHPSNSYQTRQPGAFPQTALAPIQSQPSSQPTSTIVRYIEHLLYSPKVSAFKSKINQLKLRLESLIKQRQELFWNGGLVLISIVVVIILGSI